MLKDVVGLFGTCGNSKWRNWVIRQLHQERIGYFNPVVPDWKPEFAAIEAEHLITDRVLLFVVTGDTESFGSLAEMGWAALTTQRTGQTVVFVIQPMPGDHRSAANRTRILVKKHAEKAGFLVYNELAPAVNTAIQKIKAHKSSNGIT